MDLKVRAAKAKSAIDRNQTPSKKTSIERDNAAADRTISIRPVQSKDELIV